MEPLNWANWITALATVVYTIGTLALWVVTLKTLRAMRDGFKLNLLMAIYSMRSPLSVASPDRIRPIQRMIELQKYRKFMELLKRTFPNDYESLVIEDELTATESKKDSVQETAPGERN